MQKNEDLDTVFPAKSKYFYKIAEEFLESETPVANCHSSSPIRLPYYPRYSSASRNNHSASRKCQ
jgi:hypothetical protein